MQGRQPCNYYFAFAFSPSSTRRRMASERDTSCESAHRGGCRMIGTARTSSARKPLRDGNQGESLVDIGRSYNVSHGTISRL